MISKIVILFFSGLMFCNCQLNNTEKLKIKVASHLYENKYISKSEFENKNGFLIRNIQEETYDLTNLKNHFFVVSMGSHSMICYFIYDNNEIKFLDVQSFQSLLQALDTFYDYALENKYSKEKIIHHINILVRAYYKVNKNLKTRKTQYIRQDSNCEFRMNKISDFSLIEMKKKFGKKLNIQDIDDVLINRYDMYYGLPKMNKKLNVGIYSYTNLNNPNPKLFLLYKDKTKVLEFKNNTDLCSSMKEILIFGEVNSICSEETLSIIQQVVYQKFIE